MGYSGRRKTKGKKGGVEVERVFGFKRSASAAQQPGLGLGGPETRKRASPDTGNKRKKLKAKEIPTSRRYLYAAAPQEKVHGRER